MCDSCALIGETHGWGTPMIQAELDAQYIRSVESFWCPVCEDGRQRPVIETTHLDRSNWQYKCDNCEAAGTQKQIENSAFYAVRIAVRTCSICGDKIMPAADKMRDDWRMTPSHKWTWRCHGCSFVGTFLDFASEANRQQLGTFPDFEAHPTF